MLKNISLEIINFFYSLYTSELSSSLRNKFLKNMVYYLFFYSFYAFEL